MISLISNTWPVLAALAMVGVITYGALTPYIRQERRRRREAEEKSDD